MVQILQPLEKKCSNPPLSQKINRQIPHPLQKKSFTDETAKNLPHSAYRLCLSLRVGAMYRCCTEKRANLSLRITKRNSGSNFPTSFKFLPQKTFKTSNTLPSNISWSHIVLEHVFIYSQMMRKVYKQHVIG